MNTDLHNIYTCIARLCKRPGRWTRATALVAALLLAAVADTAWAAKERTFASVPGDFIKAITVRDFYKDDRGLVWLATDKGLVAFDGFHSEIEPIYDDNNIPLIVNSILQVAPERMLVGTVGGLYLRDAGGSRVEIRKILDTAVNRVNALTAFPDGKIGVATDRGLILLDSDLNPGTAVDDKEILSLLTHKGRTYVGASDGAYEMKGGKIEPLSADFPDVAVNTMLLSGRTLYLGAAHNGLYAFDLTTRKLTPINTRNAVVTSLAEGRDGEIFVGTDGEGLMLLDKAASALKPDVAHRHKGTAYHNDQIYSLWSDSRGQLFVGYYMMGASFSEVNSKLFSYLAVPGFNSAGHSVRTVYCDDAYLFVGAKDGAYILDLATGEPIEIHKDALNSNLIISCHRDGDRFYIGTYGGGMSVFNLGTRKLEKLDFRNWGYANPSAVFCITPENDGDLWLGTSIGIYFIEDGAVANHIPNAAGGAPLGNVYEIFNDSQNRQWVCTAKGIYLHDMSTGSVGNDRFPSNFIANRDVRQVYETTGHNLLFVTYDGEIHAYDSDLQPSEHAAALAQLSDVRGVVQDKNENVWITTSDGLYRYVPQTKSIISYDGAEGVDNPIFNPGKPIISRSDDLYLCNTQGLLTASVAQTPESGMSFRNAVPTFIDDGSGLRSVSVEKEGSAVYRIRLDEYQPQLQIFFSDFSYTGFDNDRYEYSLDGGHTWKKTGTDMSVVIPHLSEDETVLKIRQLGNPRTENDVIVVNQTSGKLSSWIVLCAVAISLLLAVALVWLLIKHLRHQHAAPAEEPAGGKKRAAATESGEPAEQKKYAANYMTDKECDQLAHKMNALLRDTKIYTDPDLKIATIAEKLEVTSHKLSFVLSQYLKTNYYDYIYNFRIEEFKRLAKADKKQRYTLTALSEKAGFNSRATFFRAFKKAEGITPGEYLKRLRSDS